MNISLSYFIISGPKNFQFGNIGKMGPDLEPLKLDFRAGKIVAGEEQWNSTVAQNETRKSCGLMRFELEQNM